MAVEFYEKRRRRPGIWFGGLSGKGEEEVCWEVWNLDVTIATPRTESGMDATQTPTLNAHPPSYYLSIPPVLTCDCRV